MERVRDDKSWYQCMTFEELEDMRKVRLLVYVMISLSLEKSSTIFGAYYDDI